MKSVLLLTVAINLVSSNFLYAKHTRITKKSERKTCEKIIYSFRLKNGKKLNIKSNLNSDCSHARLQTESTLQYELLDKSGSVEFKYPESESRSFDKFGFQRYYRGGGIKNEGMETNKLFFKNKEYYYVVYHWSHSREPKPHCGIKVLNSAGKILSDLKCDPKSVKGDFFDLSNSSFQGNITLPKTPD